MHALDTLRILQLVNHHQHVKHAPPTVAAPQATAAPFLLHPTHPSHRPVPLADTPAPPLNPRRDTGAAGRDRARARAHQPPLLLAAEGRVALHRWPRLQRESLRIHPPLHKNPEALQKHRCWSSLLSQHAAKRRIYIFDLHCCVNVCKYVNTQYEESKTKHFKIVLFLMLRHFLFRWPCECDLTK